MRVTKKFLKGLPIGTDIELDDVENVTSVPPICNKISRTEGKVEFSIKTFKYPEVRKIRIKVNPYGYRERLQNSSKAQQDVDAGSTGTEGTREG